MGRIFSAVAWVLVAPLAGAGNQINMSPGVTEMGGNIFELHMLIMWICVGIGVLVFGERYPNYRRYQKRPWSLNPVF